MKVIEHLMFVPLLALFVCACKNQPVTPENSSATTPLTTAGQVTTADSLAGFKGADPFTFTRLSPGSAEYRYQKYVVKVKPLPGQPGQDVFVMPVNGTKPYALPTVGNAFFAGISRDHLFLDSGTGPTGREFIIFSLKKNRSEVRTHYLGEPEVLPNGRLLYLVPTEEKDVTKLPECPERSEWEQKGLRVGYGQVCLFNLDQGVEVKKSEWRCMPLQ